MDKLTAYIDGLLDSGAKSFSRDVIENIKAMVAPEQPTTTQPIYWPPNKYMGGTGGAETLIFDGKITCASTAQGDVGGTTTWIYNMPHTLTGIDPNPVKATTYDPSS